MQRNDGTVRVWDPFVRVFHWSLVLSYALAWATGDERAWLHERAGYFILVLIGLRAIWGLVGTRHARFGDFVFRPSRTLDYLKSLMTGNARRYLGHNPAGGWMVIVLLIGLLGTGVSGVLIDGAGKETWEEIHEGFANFTLLLVVIHVSGVVVSSLLHRENLVRAMLTGNKPRSSADV